MSNQMPGLTRRPAITREPLLLRFRRVRSRVRHFPEIALLFLNRLQPLALLFLRLALGTIFLYHGYPKLAHPTAQMHSAFVEHGLPSYFVQVAGIIETFGGGLMLVGLFARPAALLVAVEMCVAIWKVHSRSYLAVHEYEFPMALATACFVLAAVGAGLISIDHFLLGGSGGRSVGRSRPARNPRD
jgi:putative oxidoreductase